MNSDLALAVLGAAADIIRLIIRRDSTAAARAEAARALANAAESYRVEQSIAADWDVKTSPAE